jgi:acetolactate synthase regulatory subunit
MRRKMRIWFRIRAHAEPQTLLRVLNFFAQRDFLPLEIHSVQQESWLSIDVTVVDMPFDVAEIIANKPRQTVLVTSVELCSQTNKHMR